MTKNCYSLLEVLRANGLEMFIYFVEMNWKFQEVFSFWKQNGWKKFYIHAYFCEEKIVSFEHMMIF